MKRRGKAGAGGPHNADELRVLALRQRADLTRVRKVALLMLSAFERISRGKPSKNDNGLVVESGGLMGRFNTLAQLLMRLIDKERQNFDTIDTADSGQPADEQELERRIADELDRIASRATAAGGNETDHARS